jgi:hypothetical protein
MYWARQRATAAAPAGAPPGGLGHRDRDPVYPYFNRYGVLLHNYRPRYQGGPQQPPTPTHPAAAAAAGRLPRSAAAAAAAGAGAGAGRQTRNRLADGQ